MKAERLVEKIRVGLETDGTYLHLTIDGGVINGTTAVNVMVTQLGADNDVLNVDVAITSGATAGDDVIRVKLVNHTLGAECGIDLADATLLNKDFGSGKELLKLAQLLVHSYNNTNFLHISVIYACKNTTFSAKMIIFARKIEKKVIIKVKVQCLEFKV